MGFCCVWPETMDEIKFDDHFYLSVNLGSDKLFNLMSIANNIISISTLALEIIIIKVTSNTPDRISWNRFEKFSTAA